MGATTGDGFWKYLVSYALSAVTLAMASSSEISARTGASLTSSPVISTTRTSSNLSSILIWSLPPEAVRPSHDRAYPLSGMSADGRPSQTCGRIKPHPQRSALLQQQNYRKASSLSDIRWEVACSSQRVTRVDLPGESPHLRNKVVPGCLFPFADQTGYLPPPAAPTSGKKRSGSDITAAFATAPGLCFLDQACSEHDKRTDKKTIIALTIYHII